ncbi:MULTISPECIES: GNAT family N-acetyltransferase [unclassified Streptomyces]|uniref:GNAT family N-acetyltransferase n=1 Tax=unclassified Streptomyces TaxID=2593676 RepID=UPI003814D5B7
MDPLGFRLAEHSDAALLVRLRDGAARWMQERGIDQWKPGEMGEDHFRARMAEGEVWLAEDRGRVVGGWELWWADEPAWGVRPPDAGYVHRLMVDRGTAPRGAGAAMLAEAERRIAAEGRRWARLDCVAGNPRLRGWYEAAGYTVVGEQPRKQGGRGSPYAVTLLEKAL